MYCKFVACYKTTKETNPRLPYINRHMALKPQSKNFIRKNINSFTAMDFQENSRILKADLRT